MTLNDKLVYRLFKYAVYALLTLNIFLFWHEEWNALDHRFSAGLSVGEIIEAFAASIDTAAWVILLLMFELETYVLDDRQLTPRVTAALKLARLVCYSAVVYAFVGYTSKVLYLLDATALPATTDLCRLALEGWSYAVDLDEYLSLSPGNCSELASGGELLRYAGINAAVDWPGYTDILRLAWVDVINSGTWILVVCLLEADVWLQERGRLAGKAHTLSNGLKIVLYAILLCAAVYWGVKGDFVDFWDAFLWLVAFVFIERNVIEWRDEATAGALSPA